MSRSAARGMSSTGSEGASVGGRNNGKGLRHFSMKVCEKVESKGRTTYNEVADELVSEFSAPSLQGQAAAHTPLECARVSSTGSPCRQYDPSILRVVVSTRANHTTPNRCC